MPDLKFKNLVFTTAAGGSGSGGSDDTEDNGNGDNGGNSDENSDNTGGTTVLTDIAAEFEKIKNNPHYGGKLSRTLY
jgi:hypothetical protein